MDIRHLTPDFAVAPQIKPEDVAELVEAGFTTVICNRPNIEVGSELSTKAMRAAVEAVGLTWAENAITNGAMTYDNVARQGEYAAESTGPVLAYCRSGTRSATAWALSQAGVVETDEILAATTRGGYALDGLREQIEIMAEERA